MSVCKTLTIVGTASVLALGLSACGTSDQDHNASITELGKRGFQDVQYVKDLPAGYSQLDMLFTAKFNNCRVEITKSGSNGTYSLSGPTFSLNQDQRSKLAQKAGGNVNDIVNTSFLKQYAGDLGLQHCVA